jgi:putative transposase
MPWKETGPVDERMRFIAAIKTGALPMTELCATFGISRKSGYKWLDRYERLGPRGLHNASRAPHKVPWAISHEVADLLVEERRKHPTWGASKLLDLLRNQGTKLNLPAASTAHELLKRHGLVKGRQRRRKLDSPKTPLAHVQKPNDGWCADFKGHFKLGNGRRCDPLTITDASSRLLLCCKALERPNLQFVQNAFEAVFKECGLPRAIRTDNGSPFVAPLAIGKLTRLSVWWVKLDIQLERIDPGNPQQNGRHERMHKTLNETIYPPARDLKAQQRRFDSFREEFNNLRPHAALDGKPPASVYRPSRRPYPAKLPPIEYPRHHEVRTVRSDGTFIWRGEHVYCSTALIGEPVSLEEVEEGRWLLRFGSLPLAVLDARTRKIVLASLT